ncbi:TolC family protein [Thermosediminibacter oceani]|uniref:Outer membrane efflux protein n=1 Tax=Thermosediminibacter oceani (strain ATCC BAA-1034 / DSM 16646 / JW/IW-1228P) TaxID=555079 RepID=D9S0M2_THEOJ|nr:TolC family protein [Thermosediminibacter oceani]ADL08880.1 outer membrane efflux protein [Thermosediminibacter oceani DSM 16646]
MRKFGKRAGLLSIILVLALFTVSSGSDGADAGDVLSLSLEEAVDLALKNNPAVGLSQLAVEKAELKQKELQYQERKAEEKEEEYGISLNKDFDYKYQMELGKKAADMELKLSQLGVEATGRNIRFGVEAAYYAALAARDRLQIAGDSLKRAMEMERIAKALYDSGSAAKKDLLDARVKVASAEAELKKAEAEKEKAYIDLKKLLKVDMERGIELSEAFEFKAAEKEINLAELLQQARERRIDVVRAREQMELARLDFDMTKKVYPSNTFKYKEKEYALKEAELNYEEALSRAEQEVRKAYLDYIVAAASIPVLDRSLEMAEESYRLAKLSYEAGLVRGVDLMQAEEALKQAKLQKAQAIYAYNLARLNLDNVVYMSVNR